MSPEPLALACRATRGRGCECAAPPRLLTLREAAAYLSVSYWTVRGWVESGRLPHVRLPGRRLLRVDRADLDRLIAACRVGA